MPFDGHLESHEETNIRQVMTFRFKDELYGSLGVLWLSTGSLRQQLAVIWGAVWRPKFEKS